MSFNEILVVVVFGYLGYLLVSVLFAPKNSGDQSNHHANSTSSGESQNHNSRSHEQESPMHDGDDISASWFRILDVPNTASREIIATAYKRKISQYHPDKVASLGSELKELAELKSKQINAAYSYAMNLKR